MIKLKQRKIKFKPRIKLNRNPCMKHSDTLLHFLFACSFNLKVSRYLGVTE